MKKLLLLAVTLFCVGTQMEAQTGTREILVAYFSEGGNTRVMAEIVQAEAGGDLFEIKAVQTYPNDFRPLIELAKKEQQENARPALRTRVNNMDSYDIIFIGYPNWWGTMPMPVFTFLEQYNFAGKTIIPFSTHNGSRFGSSINDIRRLCPQSTIRDGLAIQGGRSGSFELGSNTARANVRREVTGWLRRLGMVR